MNLLRFTCILIALSTFIRSQNISIEFVKIPAGKYKIGSRNLYYNPLRNFSTVAYKISKYEITNSQFSEFITQTGYKTTAERNHRAQVYRPNLEDYQWHEDSSAYWRYPQGKSYYCVDSMPNHPVTCITLEDAKEFCKWARVRLPTFEEWEIACRAGSSDLYHWGKDIDKSIEYGNIWHGENHKEQDFTDGYCFTAPVGLFKPNNWGLYDMAGNVFELCDGTFPDDKKGTAHARGGSWWCSKYTCSFFNSLNIGKYRSIAPFSNIGFRVVKDL
jgi:formylglycine-generating enzyme